MILHEIQTYREIDGGDAVHDEEDVGVSQLSEAEIEAWVVNWLHGLVYSAFDRIEGRHPGERTIIIPSDNNSMEIQHITTSISRYV